MVKTTCRGDVAMCDHVVNILTALSHDGGITVFKDALF
jgi:hypothetical protein